jgi:putative two-component system response regulator
MRTHTTIGAEILSGSRSPLLVMAEQIALTHHERWDGDGYPRGLSGDQIPLPGRIVAVADVFDALSHARPYKPAWPVEQVVAEILRQNGTQFDPGVIEAFAQLDHRALVDTLKDFAPAETRSGARVETRLVAHA